jgi:hypothetical protein
LETRCAVLCCLICHVVLCPAQLCYELKWLGQQFVNDAQPQLWSHLTYNTIVKQNKVQSKLVLDYCQPCTYVPPRVYCH